MFGWHRPWDDASSTDLILHEANDSWVSYQAGDSAEPNFAAEASLAVTITPTFDGLSLIW